MVPRLVVFDLDGTLIDSQIDLANSINAMLVHLGKPELPHAVLLGYIGDGARMLVRRALGDPEGDVHDEEYVNEALEFFLAHYRIHKLDFTYVYAGVAEALAAIQAAWPGTAMAVLTNKPVGVSREICAHFGLAQIFLPDLWRQQLPHQEAGPLGAADADGRGLGAGWRGSGDHAGGDGDDRRLGGGHSDGAELRGAVDRMQLWAVSAEPGGGGGGRGRRQCDGVAGGAKEVVSCE